MHPKALIDECSALMEQVFRFDHPADAVLARFFRENRSLGSRERATLSDTVYAVLRERLRLEWLARSGSGSKWRRLAILGFPGDRDFLKSALSEPEKLWLDQCSRVTDADFLPQHRHNLPDWLANSLQAQLGGEFDALAASLLQPAPLDLRVNSQKARREAVLASLAAAGLQGQPTPWSPMGIRLQGKPSLARWDAFTQGDVEVQDEGSQLLALLLAPRRGEMVVDFCAGAGGKTLALGAMMRSTGRLYAFDTSERRLANLKPRLARSGLSNVHPVWIDSENDPKIKRLAGKIDRVLVDAPCSGLGTIRRNPDLKWRQTPEEIKKLGQTQLAILESASRLVKPGGRLVYATCSFLEQENQGLVDLFLEKHPEFEVLSAAEALGQHFLHDGIPLGSSNTKPWWQVWPHIHGTDGFFGAVLRRKP